MNHMVSPVEVQNTCLTDDKLTPVEAREIMGGMLNSIISLYQLQKMRNWENNHSCSCEKQDEIIESLNKRKDEFLQIINQAKKEGKRICVKSEVSLSIE